MSVRGLHFLPQTILGTRKAKARASHRPPKPSQHLPVKQGARKKKKNRHCQCQPGWEFPTRNISLLSSALPAPHPVIGIDKYQGSFLLPVAFSGSSCWLSKMPAILSSARKRTSVFLKVFQRHNRLQLTSLVLLTPFYGKGMKYISTWCFSLA